MLDIFYTVHEDFIAKLYQLEGNRGWLFMDAAGAIMSPFQARKASREAAGQESG